MPRWTRSTRQRRLPGRNPSSCLCWFAYRLIDTPIDEHPRMPIPFRLEWRDERGPIRDLRASDALPIARQRTHSRGAWRRKADSLTERSGSTAGSRSVVGPCIVPGPYRRASPSSCISRRWSSSPRRPPPTSGGGPLRSETASSRLAGRARSVSGPLTLHTSRDEPVNSSDSRLGTHQHWPPASATCCHSLLLDRMLRSALTCTNGCSC